MFVVAMFAAGIAAFGPIYLSSTDQTILRSNLRGTVPANDGITLQTPLERYVPKQLAEATAAIPHPNGGHWYGHPISTELAPFVTTVGPQPYAGSLVARTGVCRHVHIVKGTCPTRPGTAILSTRDAHLLGLSVGTVVRAHLFKGRIATLRVSGLYAAGNPAAPYWWGQNFFSYGGGNPSEPRLDAAFVSSTTIVKAATAGNLSAFVQVPFADASLPVASVGPLEAALAHCEQVVRTRDGVRASTQIASILARAGSTEHTTGTIVEVVDLELALLAIFVLYFVASRTAAEREPDVRLAALRGFRSLSVVGVAMAEPVALVAAAVPVGLVLAWAVAGATASATFGPGVGASVTLVAVVAAVVAGAAGVAATGIGVRQVLAAGAEAPVGGAIRTGRPTTWRVVADVAAVAVAVAAFFELSAAGVNKQGSAADALAALAPALLALAVGVLGARLLPLALKATHRRTAGSKRVTTSFATRRVARLREFAAPVMLVAVSVGLVTFAISGWAAAGRNRQARSEVEVGAPTVLTVSVPPGSTLVQLVQRVDPRGRYAMAAVLERASDGTTLAVDARRMARVMAWPPALDVPVASVVHRLVPSHLAPQVMVHGTSVALTVDTTAIRGAAVPLLSMDLYDQDNQGLVEVTLGVVRVGTHTYRGSLGGQCPGGCRLTGITIAGTSGGLSSGTGSVDMHVISLESERGGRWAPVAAGLHDPTRWSASGGTTVRPGASGLAVSAPLQGDGSTATITPADVPVALPTVVTPVTDSTASGHGGPLVVGLDGRTLNGHTVAEIPDIPGVGAAAVLVDLTTAERFLVGSYLTDTSEVWLSATAPPSVVQGLERRGVTVTGTLTSASVGRQLDRSGVSLAYLLFLIAAVAAGALAVGATAFAVAAGARRHRAELSSLHAVGVPRRLLRRFLWAEQSLALAAGAVLGVAVGLAAALVALRSIPEFVSQGGGPPLELGLAPVAVSVTVGVVVLALAVTVFGGARLVARGIGIGPIGVARPRSHRARHRHGGAELVEADGAGAFLPGFRAPGAPGAPGALASSKTRVPEAAASPADGVTVQMAGVTVQMAGVVHLYRQAGLDVVGLRSVDLDVEPGELVALLGPSGMGKTTVLRLMAGLMTASAGSVRVDGRDLGELKAPERRKLLAQDVSYVVQDTLANVLPFATVSENLWFAQHGAWARGFVPRWTPDVLLDYLGLAPLATARVVTLPLGMQQQVAIASGVAAGPRLLLADEPTGQLTATATADVIDVLHRVNATGTTVVIVTHDISIAGRFPRAVTIRDGRVSSEARQGEVYGVIDRGGTVQLPPDVLERLRPNTRIRIVHTDAGVELRDPDHDPGPGGDHADRPAQAPADRPAQAPHRGASR